MKKNVLLLAAILIAACNLLSAQCTPGNYTSPGIYPDTATNLPIAYATVPYSGVITCVVPLDTVIPPFGTVPIDSMGVTGVVCSPPLPAGFTWTTNSPSNYWHGGQKGCFVINGTANHADTGIYHLTIYAKGYAFGFAIPDTIFGYKLIVKDSTLGVDDLSKKKFTVYQNTPNPFANKTTIEFLSPVSDVYSFTVFDVIGNIVFTQSVKAVAGNNKFEFSAASLPSGLYMYKLNNKSNSYTRRMIVEGK